MGADFSRVRRNPLLDYAGVELKQGAVLLDADANELVAIVDRRLRALASDVLGPRHGVVNTRRTRFASRWADQHRRPDAAHRHRPAVCRWPARREPWQSAIPRNGVFDALMAEPASPTRSPMTRSPIYPTRRPCRAPAVTWSTSTCGIARSRISSSRTWSRPRSASRPAHALQTVWQVRVLDEEAGAGTTCGSPDADLAGWADLIAPSTGPLTTGTYEVAAVDDPCELPPTGGYRGLENQLYRVEIHDPGQPGGTRHLQVVARQRQRRQPRRYRAFRPPSSARHARPRRRAALQQRRLGGDPRRRARVRAARGRDPQGITVVAGKRRAASR